MSNLKKILLNYNVGDTCKIEIVRAGDIKEFDFKFTTDSSNIEEFKEANPKNENKEEKEGNDQILPDWLRP